MCLAWKESVVDRRTAVVDVEKQVCLARALTEREEREPALSSAFSACENWFFSTSRDSRYMIRRGSEANSRAEDGEDGVSLPPLCDALDSSVSEGRALVVTTQPTVRHARQLSHSYLCF